MRNLSIDELRTLLSDVKNAEDKKTLCVIFGVFIAVFAIAVGVIVFLIKRHCDECDYDDLYDDWEEEEDYFDDDFECEDDGEKAEEE